MALTLAELKEAYVTHIESFGGTEAYAVEEFDALMASIREGAWDEGLKTAVGGHPPVVYEAIAVANPYRTLSNSDDLEVV